MESTRSTPEIEELNTDTEKVTITISPSPVPLPTRRYLVQEEETTRISSMRPFRPQQQTSQSIPPKDTQKPAAAQSSQPQLVNHYPQQSLEGQEKPKPALPPPQQQTTQDLEALCNQLPPAVRPLKCRYTYGPPHLTQ